jgi:pimeloyl-ACP methyl ester carboxylesterase
VTGIERGFVRIAEGLVHYRSVAGQANPSALPLVLLHASPGSSRGLEALMAGIAAEDGRPLIAPDTLGNGDSAAPAADDPDIFYYAAATLRVLDALGIERFDLYGTHTGARTACEMAILAPERINRLIFDGIGEYDAAMQAVLLADYAPEMAPDDYGRQFIWAFNFVRDQALHFPHFLRDPGHRLMTRAVPDAAELHDRTIEVVKSLGSYHKAYRAAFRYATTARLPQVAAPSIFLSPADDLPSLRDKAAGYAALMQDARVMDIAAGPASRATAILDFIRS